MALNVAQTVKKTLRKLGTGFTIIRTGGNITGEYAALKSKRTPDPFIREFYIEAVVAADTQLVEGDVVLLSDGRYFLLMNKAPESFKNAVCSYDGALYKCNVVGKLHRASQATVGYETLTTWAVIGSGLRALQVESLGNSLEPETDIGIIGRETHDLYLPHSVGIREHDRWDVSTVTFVSKNHRQDHEFDGFDCGRMGAGGRHVDGDLLDQFVLLSHRGHNRADRQPADKRRDVEPVLHDTGELLYRHVGDREHVCFQYGSRVLRGHRDQDAAVPGRRHGSAWE